MRNNSSVGQFENMAGRRVWRNGSNNPATVAKRLADRKYVFRFDCPKNSNTFSNVQFGNTIILPVRRFGARVGLTHSHANSQGNPFALSQSNTLAIGFLNEPEFVSNTVFFAFRRNPLDLECWPWFARLSMKNPPQPDLQKLGFG